MPKSPLFIEGYGVSVSLSGEDLVVKNSGEGTTENIPFSTISHLIFRGSALGLTSAVLVTCADGHIPVTFLKSNGLPYFFLTTPRQYQKTTSSPDLLHSPQVTEFVKKLLSHKVRRQRAVLAYHIRSSRKKKIDSLFSGCIAELTTALDYFQKQESRTLIDCRSELFLTEARAGRAYWRGVAVLIKPIHGFPGRRGRNASDPVNQLLNYTYAILSSNVLKHGVALGMDPTREVYHHRQEASFPFLYDLIEPFRPLADHAVLAFVHRQKRSLHGKDAVLRPAVLRRFRAHWAKVALRPQPWSHSPQTLDQLIQSIVLKGKTVIRD